MAQAMDANDLMGMSLDQISDRNLRVKQASSTWSARPGGRIVAGSRDAGTSVGGGGMRSQQMQATRTQSVVTVPGGGTFRSAIASTRAPQPLGPMRRTGIARGARETAAPYQRPTRAPESVFDRLGESSSNFRTGCRLDFEVVVNFIRQFKLPIGMRGLPSRSWR